MNALTNGDVLSRTTSTSEGLDVVTYRVRLSKDFDNGMLRPPLDGRRWRDEDGSTGFVVPSQNEWIKAAYYDPRAEVPLCTGCTRRVR